MKFLLDQNLPTGLIVVLAELGHDALHVRLLGLVEADDATVWATAVEIEAVMISKDGDFVTLAGRGAALVRLRVGNRSNVDLYAIIRKVWPDVVARLADGDAMVDVWG